MRGILKKMLAVILCAALVLGQAALLTAGAAVNTPIVYVFGKQDVYKTDENGNLVKMFDDGDYLSELLDGIVPLLAKGILSGDWQPYTDHALGVLLPAFEGFAANPDGTLPEGTGINWSWDEQTLSPSYSIGRRPVYIFRPDSRLSPLVIADQINDFVQAVKRKTGADKVEMIGRCEGTALVSAYLYKYGKPTGYRDLAGTMFVNGTMNGVGYADAMMTGNVSIPADGAYRFLHNIDAYTKIFSETGTSLDAQTLSLISDIVEMLHETYGIELTSALLNRMYGQLKDIFFAKLMRAFWGTALAFVSCVNDHYEDYADYMFGDEADAYAEIIRQADDFHYNVQLHLKELVQDAAAEGVKINVIVEYGIQQYPLSEDSEKLGDYMISVEKQSFGATACNTGETLSDGYIAARTAKGLGEYISPDRQIDASTCLFPENTWFIKNLIHQFPAQLDRLYGEILSSDDSSVHTTTGGRFLNYLPQESAFVPAQESNPNDYSFANAEPTGVKNVFHRLVELLDRLIKRLTGFIAGIIAHANGTAAPVEQP